MPLGPALVAWLVLLVAIFLLGAFREALLRPRVGELPAHWIGTAVACAVVLVVARIFDGRHDPTPAQAWAVGGLWLALTLLFEFGFFHYVRGEPWSKLLADYRVREGRVWPALLATILLAPPANCYLG